MSISDAERYISEAGEYTNEYEHQKLLKDWSTKDRIAKKVVEDFKKRAGALAGKSILDAGFGNGAFAVAFAREGAQVSGLEVSPVLLDIAKESLAQAQVVADVRLYDGFVFPFADASFDYVFATSVLEHVEDARLFLREVDRVLKEGGRAYLSFPNRWAFKETHTGVWFLSYVPRRAAHWFLSVVLKRNSIAELNLHFISYPQLLRYLKPTRLAVVFERHSPSAARRLFKRSLAAVHIHQSALLKTIMVVLEKRRTI